MMRALLAAGLALAVSSATVAKADTAASHVKVDVVADTTAVRPGVPFTLAVRLQLDAGWHVYWTNPGDSGLATRVRLDLPAGFVAGPVQYPVPEVLKLPGGIINYGYENDLALLVDVTPPASAPVGPVHLSAKVSYLVCSEVCLPGTANVAVDLPVSDHASVDHEPGFRTARDRLPRPMTAAAVAPGKMSANFAHGGAVVTADFQWASPVRPKVTWIPDALIDCSLDRLDVRTDGKVTTVHFALARDTAAMPLPAQVDGLLIATGGDGRRVGYRCPIRVSAEPPLAPTRR